MDLAKWPTNRLLNTAARLTENSDTNQFRSLGVTQAGLSALRVLARGQALTLNELARKLRVRPETLSKVTDRLERSDLIARSGSPVDGRSPRLRITGQGRILLVRADDLEEEQERTLGSDEQLRAELIARIKALGVGAAETQAPPALRLVPRIDQQDGDGQSSATG